MNNYFEDEYYVKYLKLIYLSGCDFKQNILVNI